MNNNFYQVVFFFLLSFFLRISCRISRKNLSSFRASPNDSEQLAAEKYVATIPEGALNSLVRMLNQYIAALASVIQISQTYNLPLAMGYLVDQKDNITLPRGRKDWVWNCQEEKGKSWNY